MRRFLIAASLQALGQPTSVFFGFGVSQPFFLFRVSASPCRVLAFVNSSSFCRPWVSPFRVWGFPTILFVQGFSISLSGFGVCQ